MSKNIQSPTTLSGEYHVANNTESHLRIATDIRTEILKQEGLGHSQSEIVKHCSTMFHRSTRDIYHYLQTRAKWQPKFLNQTNLVHKISNRYEQIYTEAAYTYATAKCEANKIGALNTMLKANSEYADRFGVNMAAASQPQITGYEVVFCDFKKKDPTVTARIEYPNPKPDPKLITEEESKPNEQTY